MEELIRIPWGKVFANLTWIFGASIILADFSYHEFLVHREKTILIKVLKKDSFKRPFYLGLLLFTLGACLSMRNPWLAGISGGAALLIMVKKKRIFKRLSDRKKVCKS
jgi:hypothetical protein